ncbi:MAG: hypothetical protein ACTSRW_11930 [Candidatus Helarchaeota archaeon]
MTRTSLIISGLLLIFCGVVYSIPCWLSYFSLPCIIPDPFTISIPISIPIINKIPLFQYVLIAVGLLILIEGRITGN